MIKEILEEYKRKNSLVKITLKTKATYFGFVDKLSEKFVHLINDRDNKSALIEIENISTILELKTIGENGDEENGRKF
ncbi:MAG TPA: hypothetical protein VJJ23_06350 [Candidatus Nanoarchaeia archaeon]|nr:hypothetical protein [Candidatus Nanoarchaeia archaeon]